MPTSIPCPKCNVSVEFNEDRYGLNLECSSCKHNFIVQGIFKNCKICAKECEGGELLANGEKYHRKCYEDLVNFRSSLEDTINHLQMIEIPQLREVIRKEKGFLNNLSRIFSNKPSKLLEVEKSLNDKQARLNILGNQHKQENNDNKQKLMGLYDYWMQYPPDWKERHDNLIKLHRVCQTCGTPSFRGSPLQAHHRVPLGKGGSNKADNLIPLCARCHAGSHGLDEFNENKISDIGKISNYEKKIRLIEDAIKNNKILNFKYEKYEGEQSFRAIKPSNLERVGKSTCVVGFCYLRNEKRTFKIDRMSKIEIADEPGKCKDL